MAEAIVQVQQAFELQQNPAATQQQLKEAFQWLEHFQSTEQAWQVADQLLSQPPKDGAGTQIFAAQTMRSKILFDWAQLPAASHESLRTSLLGHIVRFGQGPQPVLTQLCLAIATLALHMESWGTVVTDLVSSMTSPPEEATSKLPCLLEMLMVLPEEAENFKVQVLPRRREQFRQQLEAAAPAVLQLLSQVCQQCEAQVKIVNKMLACMASWLRNCKLPTEQLAASPLISFGFKAMGAAELFDNAADMLVEAVHFSHDHEAHRELINAIVPQVVNLVPLYDAACRDEDNDNARALCRLFTETGEQYMHLILRDPQAAIAVGGAVLRGAQHSDSEIAEITFNFWYVLAEEVAGGGGRTLDEAQQAQRAVGRQVLAPIYVSLLEALRVLAELPADYDSWHADQKDDHKRFRYAVGDVITDVCKVLTSAKCVELGGAALDARLAAFGAAPAEQWRSVEVCVFCIRQMITSNEEGFIASERVAALMQLLPRLAEAKVGMLTNTCIRTVGTYASWLNRHPEMLPMQLSFVAAGLQQDATAAAASQAMKHLCDACAEQLADEATVGQLLEMYRGALQLPLHCADRVDLIAALTFVVSQMPAHQVIPAMQAIAQPLHVRLQAALDGSTGSSSEVANVLEQLCALLRGVSPSQAAGTDHPELQDAPHPCIVMLEQLWEVLDVVFARYGGDSKVMEKLCRCYKHTARNCGTGFKVVVPRLLPKVTAWFEQHPHSCFLYMCNVCLTAFGGSENQELTPLFGEAFMRMSAATFRLLSVTSNIPDNPDVVDDYFELCSKVLRRQPALLLESDNFANAFLCGCAALHIQHREAGRSVIGFFETIVNLSRPQGQASLGPQASAALLTVIGQNGAQLVHALVWAIAGVLPQSRIRFLSPVLKALANTDVNSCRSWTVGAVQALPATAHVDGQTMVAALFSEEALSSDRVFILAIDAFSSACRRKRIL